MGCFQHDPLGVNHGAGSSFGGIHASVCWPQLGPMASAGRRWYKKAQSFRTGTLMYSFRLQAVATTLADSSSATVIMRPAFISCAIALVIEVPVCICLSLWGMEAFAYYLSDSTEVALITKKMWKVSTDHRTLQPLNPFTDTHHTEHRLVLHLLCAPIPTICHPPRHQSPLVPLPIPRLQPPLDAPLGHRRHESPGVRRTGLDVLRHHLRRGARLRVPQRGRDVVCLDVEASKGKDVVEEGA